jgi:hypothetical protein
VLIYPVPRDSVRPQHANQVHAHYLTNILVGIAEIHQPADDGRVLQHVFNSSENQLDRTNALNGMHLHAAVDRGVTFFDTAEIYGPYTNEEGVLPVGGGLPAAEAVNFAPASFSSFGELLAHAIDPELPVLETQPWCSVSRNT